MRTICSWVTNGGFFSVAIVDGPIRYDPSWTLLESVATDDESVDLKALLIAATPTTRQADISTVCSKIDASKGNAVGKLLP